MIRKMSWVALLGLIVVGCGSNNNGVTTPAPATASNHPPSASVAVTPGSAPLASITTVTFTATATDPDGDAVSFAWQFGDSQTASGQAASHVFTDPGTYSVTLTATDSKGAATKIETRVVVKGIAGLWEDSDPRYGFTFSQTGLAFAGVYSHDVSGGTFTAPVDGAMNAPRDVGFYITYNGTAFGNVKFTYQCRYEGTFDESGDVFRVRSVFGKSDQRYCSRNNSFNATRQVQ
jgi:PKD repeat protein